MWWTWSERNGKTGAGGEEATRRTAAQTPRHKIHNLIQLSKLLSTSWTAATHAVPSPRIPGNLDQREPASFCARISRSTFHLTTPALPASLFSSILVVSQTLACTKFGLIRRLNALDRPAIAIKASS